ncbi:ABC transporter ATP-binding protein [Octadecabacter algicola]|uniref:ABC transporter ATP-binding protein n=1 Tax=Octadecabacter algicola TaxID=2909342 RepID=UPI0023430DDD|nr:ABC transporter ATP-binding protein [Octadecabacter algicola]
MRHTPLEPSQTDAVAVTATAEVRITAVGHTYRVGDGEVLSGIDLNIGAGEVVALIGRSGSGKSTLLHIIAGLLEPSEGVVHIGNERVTGPSAAWVMMFQAPSLFPWMTVAENAGLGLRYSGQKEGVDDRVAEVLDLVDLSAFSDRNVQDLSGGQQQRVALARSLAPNPDVLLLDEPFSALDMFTRQSMQQDVRAITKRLGLTMVLVTHDVSEAALMADRAVFLKSGSGKIVGDTPVGLAPKARDLNNPDFQAELARLNGIYSQMQTQC